KQRLAELVSAPNAGLQETATAVTTAESAFRAGLEDDLNISAALAALFDFIRDVNRLMDEQKLAGAAATKALSLLERMDTVLAVFTPDQDDEVPQAILALADERQAARKAKDFARADQIRHELDAQGWAIEDTPKGPRVKKKI
ncbi:MAG TPA: cysteine--tRNA ligase, partial [Lentisphaeria bacterium]|nr:cysteine--tRNA ligase [Lentisphaeria bacterium]